MNKQNTYTHTYVHAKKKKTNHGKNEEINID